MPETLSETGGVRVFEPRQRIGWQAGLFIAGGAAFLVVLMVWFVLMLGSDSSSGDEMMPGIIGGMSVFGIGMIARGMFLLRGVVRVALEPQGARLEGFIARQFVPYGLIERIERDKQDQLLGGKRVRVLRLLAAGRKKPLAIIPDTIEDFDDLSVELAARSAAAQGGRATFDPFTDDQRRLAREARRVKWLSAALWAFTLLFGATLCYGVYEQVHERRLARDGVTVDARIDRHFMRRVTPYLTYSFTDARGKPHEREVMVTNGLYFDTEDAVTVPVVYLPDEPEWNRPVSGDASVSFGGKFLFLCGGGTLVFGAFAVMTMLGIDIKTEGGRTRIVRHGRVIREFGASKTVALAPAPSAAHAPAWLPAAIAPPPPPPMPLPGLPPDTAATTGPTGPIAPPMPVALGAIVAPVSPRAPARPRGLIALGVLCIVFGVLGLLVGAARLAVGAVQTHVLRSGDQVLIIEQPDWARYWMIGDAVLAGGLVLSGIGLLTLKPWSRPMGVVIGALQVLSSLAAAGMIAATMPNQPETSGPGSTTVIAVNVGAILFKLLTAVFPAIVVLVLARRSSADALRQP